MRDFSSKMKKKINPFFLTNIIIIIMYKRVECRKGRKKIIIFSCYQHIKEEARKEKGLIKIIFIIDEMMNLLLKRLLCLSIHLFSDMWLIFFLVFFHKQDFRIFSLINEIERRKRVKFQIFLITFSCSFLITDDDGSNQSGFSRENSNFSPPLKITMQTNHHQQQQHQQQQRFQSSALNLVSEFF